jgi:hypothetical protein
MGCVCTCTRNSQLLATFFCHYLFILTNFSKPIDWFNSELGRNVRDFNDIGYTAWVRLFSCSSIETFKLFGFPICFTLSVPDQWLFQKHVVYTWIVVYVYHIMHINWVLEMLTKFTNIFLPFVPSFHIIIPCKFLFPFSVVRAIVFPINQWL